MNKVNHEETYLLRIRLDLFLNLIEKYFIKTLQYANLIVVFYQEESKSHIQTIIIQLITKNIDYLHE